MYKRQGLIRLSTGYVSGPEKVRELEEQFALLTGPRDEVLRLWRAGKEQEALNRYTAEYAPQSSKVREVLAEVVELSIQDAQNSLDPVSYTHLDVYKRQVLCRTPIPGSC